MNIYTERAILLSLLANRYESFLWPATDAEPGFSQILCLIIGGKQCVWHIADEDLIYFEGMAVGRSRYDGHTTAEKYDFIVSHINETR